jgi:DNA-binding response OmpR family regulator
MAGRRMLLVEDNEGIRVGIRMYFEAHGFQVSAAADCASATRLLDAGSMDLVILDYSLPDGTAPGLIARIKAAQPRAPIIVLTAYPSASLAAEVRSRGAAVSLVKPVELAYLRSVVDYLISGRPVPGSH